MFNLESKFQKNIHNQEHNFQIPQNQVVVCPWIIRNGFQNVSEVGFLPANADPYWYGFFQKIFTGNQVITATWEDSTYLTKVPAQYKFAYNFQVGKYYTGAIVVGSAEYSTEIEPVSGNEDFIAMKNSSSVMIRFENWVPNEKDMYKLYTIPDLYGGKWYYISSVKVLNDLQSKIENSDDIILNDTSIPACEVTFTSLVDKLQVSGKAVEQYVQYAGIGEPYAIPLVMEYDENNGDTTKPWIEPKKTIRCIPYQPQSANYLQVELQGANAISGIEVEGRTLTYANEKWISTPWKRLLAHNVVGNQVNDLNRTSLPSRNFYYFPYEDLSFITSKTFQEDNKTREDALAMNQSAGKLRMGGTSDWTSKETGLHKSNPLNADGVHWDYNNRNWKPTGWLNQNWDFNTSGNFYSVDKISITPNDTFVDILNKNSFIYETQPIIPLGFMSSKPYHISSIPLIGKIVSKFWGDQTINPNTTQRSPLYIGYFIDCDIAGMIANIYSSEQDNKVWCPLNAIVGDETKASKYLGTTALNTTLCFSLTDKVIEGTEVYDTIYFGQNKKENGTDILSGGGTYYYGRPNQITQSKNENDIFVIDSITVYALHKGKIKLTAFSDLSNPIWTTTIQSKASWTNSIRDWATTIMTGGWSEEYCDWTISDFPWPARPDKTYSPEINIAHNVATTVVSEPHPPFNRGIRIFQEQQWKNNFYGELFFNQDWYVTRKVETPTTVTVNYTDLGIVGVTDKTSFKNIVSQIVFPVTGKIQAQGQLQLNTNSQIVVPIGSSDTYTQNVIVGSYGAKPPVTELCLSELNTNEIRGSLGVLDLWGTQGGYTTRIHYNIALGATAITIVITEKDWSVGWNNGAVSEFNNWVRDRWANNSWYSIGSGTGQIDTVVQVPKAILTIKDGLLTLTGGSTTLTGTHGTAGQDANTWVAKWLNTAIPSSYITLANAPSGVIITNGVISWDTTVPAGTYKMSVVANYQTKEVIKQVKLTLN